MESNNNKVLIVLVVISLTLSLGLGGYIVYDKFIANNDVEDNSLKDGEVVNKKDEQGKDDIDNKRVLDDSKYFRKESIQKVLNGKDLNIEIGFYNENSDRLTVKYDIVVNNVLYKVDGYKLNVIMSDEEDFIKTKTSEIVDLIKKSFGTIKGDKDYLYFKTYSSYPSGSLGIDLFIVNDEGKVLGNENIALSGQSIYNLQGCQKNLYQGKDENGYSPAYYIGSDVIYYLEETTNDKVNEYKITIENNKLVKTLNDSCTASIAGSSRLS